MAETLPLVSRTWLHRRPSFGIMKTVHGAFGDLVAVNKESAYLERTCILTVVRR